MSTSTQCLLYCDQCYIENDYDEPLNLGYFHRTAKEARAWNISCGGASVYVDYQHMDLCPECAAEKKIQKSL